MLTSPFVAAFDYVAPAISRLVCPEVIEALGSVVWQRSSVTVMRVKPVIDMAAKVVWAVKPWAGSKKHPADKPIRPVVAVGSTVVRGIVKISIRTHGSRPDVYAN
ncbi:MAG TPA: hypothetical protein VND65_21760 [Candidatus Binatia bacterium]|nr:hypothetical protein [Candidatus Binatia bacterium]